ncbi:hypothetical protein QLX08_005896 [Tetragonisca angustula]|uniref:Uncharacterized protein n=1 Tax=Tetragonisca angustula TaxID=166442 RepID=A0AAW0ZY28_9HYME
MAENRRLVENLFHTSPGRGEWSGVRDETEERTQVEGIVITIEQMGKAIACLNPRKVLRVDGIPNAAIKEAFQRFPM